MRTRDELATYVERWEEGARGWRGEARRREAPVRCSGARHGDDGEGALCYIPVLKVWERSAIRQIWQ